MPKQITLLHVNLMEILKEFEYSLGSLLDAQELEIWDYDRVCLCGRMEEMQFEARSCVRRGIDDHVRAAIGTEPGQWTTDLLCLLDKCLEATAPFTSCNTDHLIQQSQRDLASDLRSELHAKWQTLHNLDAPWNRYSAYQDADPAVPRAESDDDRRYMFRRDGKMWAVAYDSRVCRFSPVLGMGYIHELIHRHGELISSWELAHPNEQQPAAPLHEKVDPETKQKYGNRLRDLAVDRAQALGPSEIEEIDKETACIEAELRGVEGLQGRSREFTDDQELARQSVCKAIQKAIDLIVEVCEPLAIHLRQHIKTGKSCSYTHPNPPNWTL